MFDADKLKRELTKNAGILRLVPCWVPRTAQIPGGRLRLDPRDLYACGAHRGGINERWFASTTQANNGPGTPADEGLSYVELGSERVLLKEAIEELGDELLGANVMREQSGWNVLCKFFDNMGAIPHHMHQRDEHARLVGRKGKTEGYYFPPQYNLSVNQFPYSFMGLEPGTTKQDVYRCLERWDQGDNGILNHSRAYRLEPGISWQVDAGILHAPGSLVTYEPQVNSDVFSCFQSMIEGRVLPWDMVVQDVPPARSKDLDFIVGMLDWDANVDPQFAQHRRFRPWPVRAEAEMADNGYREACIAHSPVHYYATELTVPPRRSASFSDPAAYGLIVVQGYGSIGALEVATPSVIRYGQGTMDELFVNAAAASAGVLINNRSEKEDLVILKHFGPGSPEIEKERLRGKPKI
jgi:hypothetical protein